MQLEALRPITLTEAPSLAPDDRPIDLVHLARMTLGERSLEREVLQLFDRQSTLLVARMRSAPPAAIAALAHTLKGSARGIGAWRVARAADIRAGGSLTLVSGFLSVKPRPNSAIVGAANGALESLTRALALELAPIRVNCVSPGIIDTPIRAGMPEAARRDMLAKVAAALPVGRVGVGEDIARQILTFMAVGFASGSIVYLDGGALVT